MQETGSESIYLCDFVSAVRICTPDVMRNTHATPRRVGRIRMRLCAARAYDASARETPTGNDFSCGRVSPRLPHASSRQAGRQLELVSKLACSAIKTHFMRAQHWAGHNRNAATDKCELPSEIKARKPACQPYTNTNYNCYGRKSHACTDMRNAR